jgi:hypothetical protein
MTATNLPISEIRNVLRGLSVPVFMAGMDDAAQPRLTLHVAAPHRAAEAARIARTEIGKLGCGVKVSATQWNRDRFAAQNSIEATTKALAHDTIVFDPTAAVWRSKAMVELAAFLRSELGDALTGSYLEPKTRTVYLLMNGAAFDRDGFFDETLRLDLTRKARDVMIAWRQQRRASVDLTARLCFELPAYPMVAIDDASPAHLAKGGLFRKARLMAASAAVLAFTAVGLGQAGSARAEGPAVTGPNLKLDVGGGFYTDDGAGLVNGIFTFPIGEHFGGHIQGLAGYLDDEFAWGGSAMGFWRDPDVAMVGLFVSHGEIDDDNNTRYGASGTLFLDGFDIGGQVGYQTHDNDDDGAFGRVELGWYPTDDVRLAIGGDLNPVADLGYASIEFRPGFEALPGMSFFLDGQVGENDHSSVLAGVRFYFGESTTLIDRHRRDDYTNLVALLKTSHDRYFGGKESMMEYEKDE